MLPGVLRPAVGAVTAHDVVTLAGWVCGWLLASGLFLAWLHVTGPDECACGRLSDSVVPGGPCSECMRAAVIAAGGCRRCGERAASDDGLCGACAALVEEVL